MYLTIKAGDEHDVSRKPPHPVPISGPHGDLLLKCVVQGAELRLAGSQSLLDLLLLTNVDVGPEPFANGPVAVS